MMKRTLLRLKELEAIATPGPFTLRSCTNEDYAFIEELRNNGKAMIEALLIADEALQELENIALIKRNPEYPYPINLAKNEDTKAAVYIKVFSAKEARQKIAALFDGKIKTPRAMKARRVDELAKESAIKFIEKTFSSYFNAEEAIFFFKQGFAQGRLDGIEECIDQIQSEKCVYIPDEEVEVQWLNKKSVYRALNDCIKRIQNLKIEDEK